MDLLLTGVFFFFVFLIGLIPFPLLYLFSDFGQFFLHRIMGYRKKVILSNLKTCFPGLTDNELKIIVGNVYKNLADILVEGIKGFTMLPATVKKRHFIINPEIIEPWLIQGKSVIALPAHFNNFEWGSMSAGLFTKHPIIAFYKPISNKYINRFMKWSRAKFGTSLASIYETSLVFEQNAKTPSVYLMAADQSPSNASKSYLVKFLGRETAFLHGPEKYARLYNYPVVYVDVKRVKRGFYTLEAIPLADNPASLPNGEITKRYAGKLEEEIRKSPGNWLWSHKRWKLSL